MQWKVHGRRAIYESPWVSLDLVDVEQPDGSRYEQHVVRMARPVAATVMTDSADRVLLMWRHRHVTGTWGWEIPSGRIEHDETPEQAAAREAEEETGWRPGPLRLLVASQPSNGSIDTVHYLFHAETAEHVGPSTDRSEAERIEWVPLADIRELIAKGEIVSGPTLIGVLLASATSSERKTHDRLRSPWPALWQPAHYAAITVRWLQQHARQLQPALGQRQVRARSRGDPRPKGQPCRSLNQVTVRPPRCRYPHRSARRQQSRASGHLPGRARQRLALVARACCDRSPQPGPPRRPS